METQNRKEDRKKEKELLPNKLDFATLWSWVTQQKWSGSFPELLETRALILKTVIIDFYQFPIAVSGTYILYETFKHFHLILKISLFHLILNAWQFYTWKLHKILATAGPLASIVSNFWSIQIGRYQLQAKNDIICLYFFSVCIISSTNVHFHKDLFTSASMQTEQPHTSKAWVAKKLWTLLICCVLA